MILKLSKHLRLPETSGFLWDSKDPPNSGRVHFSEHCIGLGGGTPMRPFDPSWLNSKNVTPVQEILGCFLLPC